MFFQIHSDIHLEATRSYHTLTIPPKAPYLILLGDIGNIPKHKDDYLAFLTNHLRQFRAVLLVPGNHEPFQYSWPETLETLRAFEDDVAKDDSLGTFVLLDRTVFRVPDSKVVILGCSLFSHVPERNRKAVGSKLNDFKYIRNWDLDQHNAAHQRDVEWLNAQVQELEQEDVDIMIATHWNPSVDERTIDARHKGSDISTAFATDLRDEICFRSPKVKVWAFGHTHYNCDVMVKRDKFAFLKVFGEKVPPLRLVTNQKGYFGHAEGYDPEKVIEL